MLKIRWLNTVILRSTKCSFKNYFKVIKVEIKDCFAAIAAGAELYSPSRRSSAEMDKSPFSLTHPTQPNCQTNQTGCEVKKLDRTSSLGACPTHDISPLYKKTIEQNQYIPFGFPWWPKLTYLIFSPLSENLCVIILFDPRINTVLTTRPTQPNPTHVCLCANLQNELQIHPSGTPKTWTLPLFAPSLSWPLNHHGPFTTICNPCVSVPPPIGSREFGGVCAGSIYSTGVWISSVF